MCVRVRECVSVCVCVCVCARVCVTLRHTVRPYVDPAPIKCVTDLFKLRSNRAWIEWVRWRAGREQLEWVYLRILVYLVIYDSGYVSLENLLLSWYPSERGPTSLRSL